MRALVIIVLLAGVVHADGRATAEQYFRAGAKAYAAQSFEAAAAHFEEAYRALALPEIAFSTAQAYRKLYRVDPKPPYVKRAVELYRVYLEKVKKGGRVGDAADSLGEMERELSRLGATKIEALPTIERTRIGVHVSIKDQAKDTSDVVREVGDLTGNTMEGVVTKLDGKVIEPFALLDVPEGDHVVSVTAAGYFPVEKKQRAVRGATALVEVELEPQPAAISVKTDRGARIAIDGRGVPSPSFELPAGKHLLTITRSGREPFGKEVHVTRGQKLEIKAPLEKTAKRRAVPWVLGGASVLAALSITSVALAAVHDSRASDLDDEIRRGNASPTKADDFDREIRDRDDYKTGAWVFGGAAVVAGTVGILLYAFDSPSAENVRLTATPTSAGVTATGRF
ncbi:MAG: PEGA domain-containing protein [Myxococcota bacterium]|nr:PEGA domain-containing protein [Myxococcota bacterium]